MANVCEVCGSEFSVSNPCFKIDNHSVCRSCKREYENYDSFEEFQNALADKKEKIEKWNKVNTKGVLFGFVIWVVLLIFCIEIELYENLFLFILLIFFINPILIALLIHKWNSLSLSSSNDLFTKSIRFQNDLAYVMQDVKEKGYNFTIQKSFDKYCIAADHEKKKILIKNEDNCNYKIYNYSDILSFDLEEDGTKLIEGKAGSAAVGGLMFGTVGAVVGAARKKDIKEYCTSLILSITINDPSNYRVQISFLVEPIERGTQSYQTALNHAKEMAAILQLATKSEEASSTLPKSNATTDIDNSIYAIKKYKELLDAGIITQEEFDEKKKQLL